MISVQLIVKIMIKRDDGYMEGKPWEQMSPEEKKIQLYLKQKAILDGFLIRNAISEEQYEKSLSDMTEKMGMSELLKELTRNH